MHCNECGDLIQVRCYCHTCYEQLDAENARLRAALVRVVAWGNERNFDTTCESGKMLINARAALGKETT